MGSLCSNKTVNLLKFNNHNPRLNLPKVSSRKRGESNFSLSFQRAYLEKELGVGGKEFALSGYGIADFVWVSFSSSINNVDATAFSLQNLIKRLRTYKLTAFELKLYDWRKAIKQAYRYSYFADKAVVVLPAKNISPAKKNLDRFKQFQIGLWAFNSKAGKIDKIYTPRGVVARNLKAREKAIDTILNKWNLSKFRKQSNPLT